MNRITAYVVSAVIIIAGLAVIFVPMTMEFSNNIHSTADNTGPTYNLTDHMDKVELTISGGKGYVNGEQIKESDYNGTMLMFADTFIVSYNSNNEGTIESYFIVTNRGTSNSITSFTAENGTYSAMTTTNQVMTDNYDFLLSYDKNGNYMRAYFTSGGSETYYVNEDSEIFIGWATTSSNSGLMKGTISNQTQIFNNGDETGGYTITSEIHMSNPNVYKVSGMTSTYSLFVPVEYDTLDNFDNMLRMMVNISPVLIGLMFFVAVGMGMVDFTRRS